jgi:hypothetical protein
MRTKTSLVGPVPGVRTRAVEFYAVEINLEPRKLVMMIDVGDNYGLEIMLLWDVSGISNSIWPGPTIHVWINTTIFKSSSTIAYR